MDDDVAIIYVDTKADDSVAESTIGAFDSVTGYANAVIMTEKQGNPASDVIVAVFVETSNEEDVLAPTKTLSAADIKALPDGAYIPNSVTGGAFTTSVTDPAKLRVFKFTADTTNTSYTLKIKNAAGTQVYEETGSISSADGLGHYFYVAVGQLNVSGLGGAVSDTWSGVNAAPAGNYTYEIFAGNETTAISSGSFTY